MALPPKIPKRKGSPSAIAITHDSIEILLRNNATATQICAFIVICANRQGRTGNSTTGLDAISKCVGIGWNKAKAIVDELLAYDRSLFTPQPTRYERLIRSVTSFPDLYDRVKPDGAKNQIEYLEANKDALQKRKTTEKRWKGIEFDPFRSIWLKRAFVGNKLQKVKPPVYHLNRRKNDLAAKLLLVLYAVNDLVQQGVSWSRPAVMEHRYSCFGNTLYVGTLTDAEPNLKLLKMLFPSEHIFDQPQTQKLWAQVTEALDMLESERFLKKVVVVNAWGSDGSDRICSYDLHIKGERYTGSLREKINLIAANALQQLDIRVDGRSHGGTYYALAPEGAEVKLSMVFRLSHVATVGRPIRTEDTRTKFTEMAHEWANHHELWRVDLPE